MSKFTKARKKRWLKALRSGKYAQGIDALHDADGSFCCLGVLCDIEADGYWSLSQGGSTYNLMLDGALIRSGSFARSVTGLSWPTSYHLASMNDNGVSFEEIADWIEENL